MKRQRILSQLFLGLSLILGSGKIVADPVLQLIPNKSDAIYQISEEISWQVELRDAKVGAYTNAAFLFKEGGGRGISQGSISLQSNRATIHASLCKPGTILAEVIATNADRQIIQALAGAAIAPDQIPPSTPCPEDFDVFWHRKLVELATVPENPRLMPKPSGKNNISYWEITLDNIRGSHIHGQLARPVSGKKLPAMLIVQWAGVYPLDKTWVTDRAAEGWLVLNILAHDLPINKPKQFYEKLNEHELNNYPTIGADDREQSYFLRMFLACYRAVDYLSERADWDGKTIVVTGTSQGGLQAFVAAGLNRKVTAVLALVPAGCDNTGSLAGRKPGWPYWVANGLDHDKQKLLDTCRYFDGVNFAARMKCPALVGLGLIDTTATPSGIFSAVNEMQGPKEVVVMPDSDHHGENNTQAPFIQREAAWRNALLEGLTVPPKSSRQKVVCRANNSSKLGE